MPDIHIHDVPDSVHSVLRERAALHGRSIEQEVLAILAAAIAEPATREVPGPIQLVTARTSSNTTWRREDTYGDEAR